jgi:hypothetical protein
MSDKPEKIIVFKQYSGKVWECRMKGVILPGEVKKLPRMLKLHYRKHLQEQKLLALRSTENNDS